MHECDSDLSIIEARMRAMLHGSVEYRCVKTKIHSTSNFDHGSIIDDIYIFHPVVFLLLETKGGADDLSHDRNRGVSINAIDMII